MDVSIAGHTPQSKHGVQRQSSTSVSSRASSPGPWRILWQERYGETGRGDVRQHCCPVFRMTGYEEPRHLSSEMFVPAGAR